MESSEKRKREQILIGEMIALYCKKNHKSRKLCESCEELRRYAVERSEHCPYAETKTFCSSCKTHCYKPEMRERIRAVMRFSGPRIILKHPVLAIRHALESRRERNETSKI